MILNGRKKYNEGYKFIKEILTENVIKQKKN